jgi:formate hydrogenlyase subunit 3/multisubunit Na+/H+ antiporter MnhD subunit
MYYPQTPPYFMLAAGLFIAITSGVAFSSVLTGTVGDWYDKRSTRSISKLKGFDLQLPFIGICLGSCLFLASGMGIFGFPETISYAMAAPLVLLSAVLVWSQLRKNLAALESGNTKAFELDGF